MAFSPEYLEKLRQRNAEIAAELDALEKEQPAVQQKNPSFLESAKAGLFGVAGTGLKGLADLTGSETFGNIGKTVSDWSGELAPQGPQDVTDYLAYYGAGMLPSMVAGGGAGLAARGLMGAGELATGLAALGGASAVNYPIQYGGNLEEQELANEGVIKDRGAAMLAAIPQTLMDSILDVLVATKVISAGGKALKAGDKAGSIFTRVIKDAGTGALVETPTEVGQLILQKLQAGVDPTSPESLSQIAETATVAAAMGGLFGGAGGAYGHVQDVTQIRKLDAEAEAKKKDAELKKALSLQTQKTMGISGLARNQTPFPALEYMGEKDENGNPIPSEPIGARYEYTSDIAKRVGMFADPTPGVESRPTEPVFNLDGLGSVGKEIKNYYQSVGVDYQDNTIPLSRVMKLPALLKQKVFDAANGVVRDPINPKAKKIPGKPYSPQQKQAILDKLLEGDVTPDKVAAVARLFKPDNVAPYVEGPVSPEQTVAPEPTTSLQVPKPEVPTQKSARKIGSEKKPERTPVPETTPVVSTQVQAPVPTTAQQQVINPPPPKDTPAVKEIKERRKAAREAQSQEDPAIKAQRIAQARADADRAVAASRQGRALGSPIEDQQALSRDAQIKQAVAQQEAEFVALQQERQKAQDKALAAANPPPTVNQGSLPGRNSPGLAPLAPTSSFPYGMDNNTKVGQQTEETVAQTVERPETLAAMEAMGHYFIQALKRQNAQRKFDESGEKKKAVSASRDVRTALERAREHYKNAFQNGNEDQFNVLFRKAVEHYGKTGKSPFFQSADSPGKSEYVGSGKTAVPTGKLPKSKTTKTTTAKAGETATSRSERDTRVLERAQRFLAGAKKTKVTTRSAGEVEALEYSPWLILKMGKDKYKIFNTRSDFPEAVAKRISTPNYPTAKKAAEVMANEIENFLSNERMRPFMAPEKPNAPVDATPPANQTPLPQKQEPKKEAKQKSTPKEGTKAAAAEAERLVKAAQASVQLDLASFDTFKKGFKPVVKEVSVAPKKDLANKLKPTMQKRTVYVNGKFTLTPVYKKTNQFPYGDTSQPVGSFITVVGSDGKPEVRPELKKGKTILIFKASNLAIQAAYNSELTRTGNKAVQAPVNQTPVVKNEKSVKKGGPSKEYQKFSEAMDKNEWDVDSYSEEYMGLGRDEEERFSIKPGTELDQESLKKRNEALKEMRILLNKAKLEEKTAYGNSRNAVMVDKDGKQYTEVEGIDYAAAKKADSYVKKAYKQFVKTFPEDDGSAWDNFIESKPLNAPRPEYSSIPNVVSAIAAPPATQEKPKASEVDTKTSGMEENSPAVREKKKRAIKAAVEREYDLDAARTLIEDLVAEGVLEKAGDGVYRKVNTAQKYEEIARRLEEFDSANRVSRVDTTEPATRLVFEVRQISNPQFNFAKDSGSKGKPSGTKIGIMRFNPRTKKQELVYKEGTSTPIMFDSHLKFQEALDKMESDYKNAVKEYEAYVKQAQAGSWPADKPAVIKPVKPVFTGKPIVISYKEITTEGESIVNGKKKKTTEITKKWEPDESANRWAVFRVGYGSNGKMVKEQVESVFTKEADANAEAAHLRKMSAGMGFAITDADINQANRLLSNMAANPQMPNTDAMKVVFTALKDVYDLKEAKILSSGAPLNLTPDQMVKVLGAEMKNSSALPDDKLKKKYGELYTTLEALINEMFANTGLAKFGVQQRIVDLLYQNPSIQGSYKNKLITTAFAATVDPKLSEQQNKARIASVFTHETFHAFKALGLISQEELNELYQLARTKKAANGKTYIQNAQDTHGDLLDPAKAAKSPEAIKKASLRLVQKGMDVNSETIAAELVEYSRDVLHEEAVAEMAADWAAGRIMPPKADGFFRKIVDFFMRLFSAGNSRYPAEKIFEDMADGTIAKRTPAINQIDGTRFSIKTEGDHVILVHRMDVSNFTAKPLEDSVYNTVLQIVNKYTGQELARATVNFNYATVPGGRIDPTASVMRAYAYVVGIATPSGESLDGKTTKKILEALGRKTQIRMAGGDRMTGGHRGQRPNADGMNQVIYIKSYKQIENQDLTGFEEYKDADLFSEDDFYEIDTALQPDDDEVLKEYGQAGRLTGESVYAMLREGVALRKAVDSGEISQSDVINYRDKHDVMNSIGIPDEYKEVVSIPQLLMIKNWVNNYMKRKFTTDELKEILSMPSSPPGVLYQNNIPRDEYFEFFESQFVYRNNDGFSGEQFTDNDYSGELFSIKQMAEEDEAFKAGADMGLDPFGNFNDGLGERLRPAATQKRRDIMDRDYAYTITLRHIQWFANKMTPKMVKNFFGIEKQDIDNFVQKWHASFVDANTSIGYVVDYVRKAGGYIDDRTDVYLQAELKSDEIIPEVERVRREYVEPIVDFMVANDISVSDANDFLNAMHAPERNDLIRKRRAKEIENDLKAGRTPAFDALYGSGTTYEQAANALKALEAEGKVVLRPWIDDNGNVVPGRYETQSGKLHEFGKLYQGLVAETNRIREQNGLIPPITEMMESENFPNFRYYAPLKGNESLTGDDELDNNTKARVGVKYGASGLEDKHATGRFTKAARILEHTIMQNYDTIIRAKRANVGQAFHEFVQNNRDLMMPFVQQISAKGPIRKALTADGRVVKLHSHLYKTEPQYFVTKIDGKEVVYEFARGPDGGLTPQAIALSRAMRGFSRPSDANTFVKTLQKVNQYLARLNTAWNPEFTITNLIRDLGLAMFNVGQYDIPEMQRQILKNWRPAYKTIRGYDPKKIGDDGYMKIDADGNTFTDPRTWTDEQLYHALRSFGGLSSFYDRMDLDAVVTQLKQDIDKASGKTSQPKMVMDKVKSVVGAIENWNTAIEHATRLSAFKAMLHQGVPIQRAAQATKNLTVNFNKGGEQRVLMNALYLFYNASIQGTFAMLNAIHRSPMLMRATMYLVAAGFMADMANDALSDEEPDGTKSYDNLKSWKKESAINIPIGNGQYLSIPLPWGLSFFWNIGRASSYAARTGNINEATFSMMSGLVSNFSPIGSMENMANFFAPTILDPIINVSSNVGWDGRAIQPENLPFGPQKPNSQLYWNSTSGTMKETAALLNSLSGGDENFPGVVDISPEILNYGANFLLGGAGMFVIRGGDFFTQALPDIMAGEDWEWNQIPFFRRAVTGVSKRSAIEAYSKNLTEAVNAENALKTAYETGDTEKAQAYIDNYGKEINAAQTLKAIQADRLKIKNAMKEIRDSKTIEPSQKEGMLKTLRDKEMELVYMANRIYNER